MGFKMSCVIAQGQDGLAQSECELGSCLKSSMISWLWPEFSNSVRTAVFCYLLWLFDLQSGLLEFSTSLLFGTIIHLFSWLEWLSQPHHTNTHFNSFDSWWLSLGVQILQGRPITLPFSSGHSLSVQVSSEVFPVSFFIDQFSLFTITKDIW
jgi:hypothetical protein